jgi:hypothetical protein
MGYDSGMQHTPNNPEVSMTQFVVVLDRALRGASVGSTEDDIEADTAEAAEAIAIASWKTVAPQYTYHALITTQVRS